MVYEASYADYFTFGDIFIFTYGTPGPNLYNYYKHPEGTIYNLGLRWVRC